MSNEYENTGGSRSGGRPVLKPCGHCGEQCADLIIDQGDKWAHYSASCLEVRTGYNLSDDAPWRDYAIAAWNTRQPTQIDALQAENAQLRHDLERYMSIANEHVNEVDTLLREIETLRVEALAERLRGYYDGCANPIVRHDALREALEHCADAIASWAKKPEGADPWLLGALDNALEVLEQSK